MIDDREVQWGPSTSAFRGRWGLFRAALAGVALVALAACAGGSGEDDDTSGAVVGNMGAVEFQATALDPPVAGPNAFQVRLWDRGTGAPLEGAALHVDAVMPSMGHQAIVEPAVEEIAPGLYEVRELVFSMPGTWEVRYRASRASLRDEAAFRYEVR